MLLTVEKSKGCTVADETGGRGTPLASTASFDAKEGEGVSPRKHCNRATTPRKVHTNHCVSTLPYHTRLHGHTHSNEENASLLFEDPSCRRSRGQGCSVVAQAVATTLQPQCGGPRRQKPWVLLRNVG